jgi:hypothetical protein
MSKPHVTALLGCCCVVSVLALLSLTLSGCNFLGVAAYKLAPDPVIPAQYVPPKEPTLILVENYHNPAALRLESETLARELMEDLKAANVAPLVDPEEAAALRHKDVAAYRKMPLDAIGRAVGAKQVIYVDLMRFEVTHALASELFGGIAEARVRIVDDAGGVLWPTDSAGGYPLNVKVNPQRKLSGVSEDAVRQQLNTELAEKIGKLFHSWKSDTTDGGAEQFDQQQ